MRAAVEAAPDYADARALRDRLLAEKESVDAAYAAACDRVNEIWDREADRLYGSASARHTDQG
ncbi:hypothetical protein BKG82_26910 [Mycobacteroides chelonae]|uniref:Uncharacterized protein n=1 Tax=Mycobacteroides chelonae TaxID=1774 RepID=A0A1S1LL14_MYCCH|nr:hypothetical protein [Mycobacteroides chelonae]OHU47284.1 hypothetical protein BKG82_26910 [Mycobacteroides chelonae]